MSRRKPLDAWIAEAMNDPHKDGPLTRLALVVMIGMLEKELHTVNLGPGHTLVPESLADLFIGKATTYGQDLPGQQTYQVLAFYKERKEPEARYPFVPIIPADMRATGLTTEAPTPQGQMQQEMRIKNDWMGMVFRRQSEMDQSAIERERMDRQYIRELIIENRECLSVVKDMMIQMADNGHNHRMQQLEYQRKTEERKKWLSFGPALINSLVGKEIFPQNLEDTALIEACAESIAPEHITMLSNVMPPALWGPLSARLEKAMKEKRLLAEQVAQLPVKNPVAASDAETGNKAAE